MNGKAKRFLPFMSKKQKNNSSGINTMQDFYVILKHERARVDRNGSEFTLIAFEVNGITGKRNDIKTFIYTLRDRIRAIDEIGWMDEKSIGVLLPSTSFEGGCKFAVDFKKEISIKSLPPAYYVYTYPEHWLNKSKRGQLKSTTQKNSHHDKESTIKRNKTKSPRAAPRRENKVEYEYNVIQKKMEYILLDKLPNWKRIIDIVGSIALIILSFPLFVLISAYIKMLSPGPVLYKQKRVGYKGDSFIFLKFRTMKPNNDISSHKNYLKDLINSDAPMEKLDEKSDPRIIPGGKIIRKACLDELPQLINVLRGDMSLVGPRPCLPYEAEEYSRWHTNRFDILPGITGLWQVSGKNSLSFTQMIRLDISYANNMSIWLDLKIILLTLPAIIGWVIEAIIKRLMIRTSDTQTIQKEPVRIL